MIDLDDPLFEEMTDLGFALENRGFSALCFVRGSCAPKGSAPYVGMDLSDGPLGEREIFFGIRLGEGDLPEEVIDLGEDKGAHPDLRAKVYARLSKETGKPLEWFTEDPQLEMDLPDRK